MKLPSRSVLVPSQEQWKVHPWDYNPSAWTQRIPICLLAFVAALISAHLTAFQWHLIDYVWDPIFGEQSAKVIGSDVAKKMDRFIGIPDAALGAIAYLGDAIFGLAGSTRRWQDRPWLVILFGFDVIPLGIVSVILVLIQTFVLGQWCFLCLVTAAISLVLIYWAYDEVYTSIIYLWRVYRRGGLRDAWVIFCGFPTESGIAIADEMMTPPAVKTS